MKRFIALFFALSFSFSFAQENDPVLLTIDGRNITRSEFEAVYRKNNRDEAVTPQALSEYLDLYINFKMKVREAEEMGLDTAAAFRTELAGYRRQLAQPYLTDSEVTDQLITEAYDRLKTDIRASHILFTVAPDASPKDTLQAYNTALNVRNSLLKGADFASTAKEVSQDPSAKDNGGDLGYFTAMMMVYPFESAAYATPVGEISMPVRTRFGYHLVKVTDKRPARGQIQVGHVMISTQNNTTPEDSATSRRKIYEIYDSLKAGKKFEDMAQQYSDDRGSAAKGGQLPWFGTGRMVPEFENMAFSLQENGQISEPFQTRFGWHILKKYDQKGLAPFEEMKAELKTRIARDSRAEKSTDSFIAKLKKEYNFKETPKMLPAIYASVDTSFLASRWQPKANAADSKTLFTLGDTTLTRGDFVAYLKDHQGAQGLTNLDGLLPKLYQEWVDETIMNYEDSRLEKKYPQFRALMQEYRDGILLFDLTDKKVWSKAVKDSTGLEAYYQGVKSSYMWPQRLEAVIYTASSEDAAEETFKLLKKAAKKGYTPEYIRKEVNEESELTLRVDSGLFTKEDLEGLENMSWQPGISGIHQANGKYIMADIRKVHGPEPKALKDIRGLVTAEYQNLLEKEWIATLRKKYPVEVNRSVLEQIK